MNFYWPKNVMWLFQIGQILALNSLIKREFKVKILGITKSSVNLRLFLNKIESWFHSEIANANSFEQGWKRGWAVKIIKMKVLPGSVLWGLALISRWISFFIHKISCLHFSIFRRVKALLIHRINVIKPKLLLLTISAKQCCMKKTPLLVVLIYGLKSTNGHSP